MQFSDDHMERLLSLLTSQQRSAIALLVQGKSQAEVARAVGRSSCTVTRWVLHETAFREALSAAQQRVERPMVEALTQGLHAAADAIRQSLPDAVHVLRAVLSDPDATRRERMWAATALLDRGGLDGRDRALPAAEPDPYKGMPMDELLREAERLLQEHRSLS